MQTIDLRSDTVTKPTPAMRQVIAEADVGDDVYGEDPLTNALQNKIAEMTGKQAALFVPSGTQANQIALNSHTQPGDEVICEYYSHIFNFEAGAGPMLSGIQLHPLRTKAGILEIDDVRQAIRPADHHFAQTRLIAVENTHNRHGGRIYPLANLKELRDLADRYGLKLHLDGARLWNASIATGKAISEYTTLADSVSLCFSKGLGAPVGSVLAGSSEFINRAHYYRKAYGGGMRQAGILAAAAVYAIDHQFKRLADDHRRAKDLALHMASFKTFFINTESVETNIIIIGIKDPDKSAADISSELKEQGILISAISSKQLRAVLNLGITDSDLDYVKTVLSRLYNK